MRAYFEIDSDGGTLKVPDMEAADVLARNVANLRTWQVAAFFVALAERLSNTEGVAAEMRCDRPDNREAVRDLFAALAGGPPGGGAA